MVRSYAPISFLLARPRLHPFQSFRTQGLAMQVLLGPVWVHLGAVSAEGLFVSGRSERICLALCSSLSLP